MPFLLFILAVFGWLYVEISLLIWAGSYIGALGIIILLVLSALWGVRLIQLSGLMTLFNVRSQLMKGELPTRALLKSVIGVVAGILFIIPGLLSDLLALLMLFSPISALLEIWLINKVRLKVHSFFQGRTSGFTQTDFQQNAQAETVFDAEFERQVDEEHRLK